MDRGTLWTIFLDAGNMLIMKKYVFSIVLLAFFGAGCLLNNQPNGSSQASDDFSLKQKCASYIAQVNKDLDESNKILSGQSSSLDKICFSRKYNTCIAFIETSNSAQYHRWTNSYWYSIRDVLTGEDSQTALLDPTSPGQKYKDLNANSTAAEDDSADRVKQRQSDYLKEKQLMWDKVQCVQ